ncbi:LOB domain-containing protein 33-like [Aristolochia californica]|uniref:LOB domain-containing protein 33-like n=1 Tax=Aristolochia californica TaxID=171875 RepID=UPI0035E012ED
MSGNGSSCGACKFLRRKCTSACVFAPYFCYEQGATHFAAIHKVFGASNVSKLLSHLPMQNRGEAAISISYEAQARIQDPIYGCVAHIFALQEQHREGFELLLLSQVAQLQEEIEYFATQVALPVAPPATSHAASCGRPLELNNFGCFQFTPQDNTTNFCDSYDPQATLPSQAPMNVREQWIFNKGFNPEVLPMDGVTVDIFDDSLFNQAAGQQNCSEKFPFSMTVQEIWPCDPLFENVIYPDY